MVRKTLPVFRTPQKSPLRRPCREAPIPTTAGETAYATGKNSSSASSFTGDFFIQKEYTPAPGRRKFTGSLQRNAATAAVSALNRCLTNKKREMMHHGYPPSCSFLYRCHDFSPSRVRECFRIGA
jgi:hypothetical protein